MCDGGCVVAVVVEWFDGRGVVECGVCEWWCSGGCVWLVGLDVACRVVVCGGLVGWWG